MSAVARGEHYYSRRLDEWENARLSEQVNSLSGQVQSLSVQMHRLSKG
nr:MbeD/MobD family mobilization/exclusion protein [Dickeya solani]